MDKYISKIKKFLSDLHVIGINLYVFAKAILLGILFVEISYFSVIVSYKPVEYIIDGNHKYFVLFLGILCLIFLSVYLYVRGFFNTYLLKIIKSKRIDVLLALIFGMCINVIWGGIFIKWYNDLISSLSIYQLMVLISIPFIFTFLLIGKAAFWKKKDEKSFFLPDSELENREDDLLNFTEKANKFAERIYNNGSSESFVFGVDAPWGIGKSTFINFCKEYCEEKHKSDIVFYKFSPLRYAGANNLLEIFIDGLINTVQKNSFIPEIRPLISKYSRLLKEINRFSFLGFSIPSFFADYTVDEALNDLKIVLRNFDKKVIIVVDDLDRIDFSEIKNVLFVIRKSFALPNISYVLCYDAENIGVLEVESLDIDKVSEFLEKFVNIKISLYLDKKDLANYVSENRWKSLSNKFVDPMLVNQAIGGLLDIYKSPEYHKYLPFIGDIRKLKRLINMVMMFELHRTDFKNSDFDKRDLIHLLLIYIHYPNIFRKIYDTETNGGCGFFSLVLPHEDGYDRPNEPRSLSTPSEYRNSTYYDDYIKQFPENSRQRFLLDQVFNVNVRLEDVGIDNIPDDVRTSLACINGGWTNGRNLETYLDLIVNLSKPEDLGQHRFYANWRDQIAAGSVTIENVFAGQKFSYDKSEKPREKLWRIIVNNARELNKRTADSIITYLLDNIDKYSILEMPDIGIGLRHNVVYFLIRLLNDAGWSDKSGKHSQNTEENVKEIAEWIFGEKDHINNGVLEKLVYMKRGILGLYDLMSFRLFCSTDRGGDIFDLARALSKHGDKDTPTTGNTCEIVIEEMREISQKVFQIFKKQYIDVDENIFDKIESIQLGGATGVYKKYVKEQIEKGIVKENDIKEKLSILKSRIMGFIIYQLANDFISGGIGCGFYDPEGKEDKHKIKEIVNDYLFCFCFNPKNGSKNYEHFLGYLLRNFASVFASMDEGGRNYIPNINEFTKILDKSKLADYWKLNADKIKKLNLHKKSKEILVGNYTASYKEDLLSIYRVLDDFIKGNDQGTLPSNSR